MYKRRDHLNSTFKHDKGLFLNYLFLFHMFIICHQQIFFYNFKTPLTPRQMRTQIARLQIIFAISQIFLVFRRAKVNIRYSDYSAKYIGKTKGFGQVSFWIKGVRYKYIFIHLLRRNRTFLPVFTTSGLNFLICRFFKILGKHHRILFLMDKSQPSILIFFLLFFLQE